MWRETTGLYSAVSVEFGDVPAVGMAGQGCNLKPSGVWSWTRRSSRSRLPIDRVEQAIVL